ncbi:MAG: hypothetical protein M3N50_11690 [Pseudomonadota bacterium]|nr:hypothetical protein [Pseudomonadota bacterium]
MYRRKVMVTAAAVFAIGVAFAAQPTSLLADRGDIAEGQRSLWVPGTNALMSAHEPIFSVLTPPP